MSDTRVHLTNPDRVLFPDDGITKGDLFEYYGEVASAILPHLHDRPFTMKRWHEGMPFGACFWKKLPPSRPSRQRFIVKGRLCRCGTMKGATAA